MSSPSPDSIDPVPGFRDLGLSEPVLRALETVGYETPSPIQGATIPPLLAGCDVLGQAQTGTGKTAAFALPILSGIDLGARLPQALVLAPTRELAIQVAEAFQKYAARLSGFHVLPIYGGQSYEPQLKSLRRGVHVVVGTPGRVLDHMKRGTLDLSQLKCLVLDEADEMLRMGFIDDVEYVLKETPPTRQVALFSATMPTAIRRIAQTYLKSPVEITIKSRTTTATDVRQRYWLVSGSSKLDALTRILEAETFDGMLVFTRTKAATQELADKLAARGLAAGPLNGDMEQKVRERTIARLKNGELDIVVATDVAARGLDVERISHVVNYDIPTDTESYVHRIGRTGRAGRSGEAILFIMPRERHLLKAIERSTRQTIPAMELPSAAAINRRRVARFTQKIDEALAAGGLDVYRGMIENYAREHDLPPLEIAAALARMAQGDTPLLPDPPAKSRGYKVNAPPATTPAQVVAERAIERPSQPSPVPILKPVLETVPEQAPAHVPSPAVEDAAPKPRRPRLLAEEKIPKETFRIEVGREHGVAPANIVGAIANEAGMDAQYIGRVEIREDHSLVDLPTGMPKQIFRDLQKVWICGRQLRMSRAGSGNTPYEAPRGKHAHPAKPAKPGKPVRGD